MPIKLPPPIFSTFILDEIDAEETGDEKIEIGVYQATTADQDELSSLNDEVSRVFDQKNARVEVKTRWPQAEQIRTQVFLTLGSCNITIDDKGTPLFRFETKNGRARLAMSKSEFAAKWGDLPTHWSEAIHRRVLEANPRWNPNVSEGE